MKSFAKLHNIYDIKAKNIKNDTRHVTNKQVYEIISCISSHNLLKFSSKSLGEAIMLRMVRR